MGTTTKLVLLLPLLLCFTSGRRTSSPQQCKDVRQQRVSIGSPEDWDILIFSQNWLPAACILLEDGFKYCNLGSLKSWTIHGLWPTKTGTKGPNFCNESAAFDPSILQVLEPRLRLNWPTVVKGEDPASFWTHEWCKHGTCGTSVPALRDELHFFNTTLGLHDRFNLTKFLINGSITPSEDNSYKYDDVLKTLRQGVGFSPLLSCAKDKTSGKCYLEQVELCLTKSFQPIDCVRSHGKHDLLFQSETAFNRGRQGDSTCSCESEDLYYMPFPSV